MPEEKKDGRELRGNEGQQDNRTNSERSKDPRAEGMNKNLSNEPVGKKKDKDVSNRAQPEMDKGDTAEGPEMDVERGEEKDREPEVNAENQDKGLDEQEKQNEGGTSEADDETKANS